MTGKSIYADKIEESKARLFTISILVDNKIGVLNRIAIIFTRRRLNIESISSTTPQPNEHGHITIELVSTPELIEKVIRQIQKLVEVVSANYYDHEELYHHEVALYKLPIESFFGNNEVENIIFNTNAKILAIEKEFVVIEKSGEEDEIRKLFHSLKEFGLLEFVRSGRVAITKSVKHKTSFFKELEDSNYNLDI